MMLESSSSFRFLMILVLGMMFHISSSAELPSDDDEPSLEQYLKNKNQEISALKQEIQSLREEVSKLSSCCDATSALECPPGFVYQPSVKSCYKVVLESLTWDQSQERCRQEYPGSHAVVVSSEEENRVIVEYLGSFSADETKDCQIYSSIGF